MAALPTLRSGLRRTAGLLLQHQQPSQALLSATATAAAAGIWRQGASSLQQRFYRTSYTSPSKRHIRRLNHRAGRHRMKSPPVVAELGAPIQGPVIPWQPPQLEVWVHDWQQKSVGILPVSREVFGQRIRKDIVHRVVTYQRAKRRFGLAKAKTRAEVSGGGKKPRPQKGSGRSRHGSIRSPLWRKGGKAHGPVVRSHATELPKKIRALGLKIAISAKYAEGNLFVINNINISDHKTQTFAKIFKRWQMHNSIIMYSEGETDLNLLRAVQAMPGVSLMKATSASVIDIVRKDSLFISLRALQDLEERLRADRYSKVVFNANVPEEVLLAQTASESISAQ